MISKVSDIIYESCSKCNGFPLNGHCEYCGLFLDDDLDHNFGIKSEIKDKIDLKLGIEKKIIHPNFLYDGFETYSAEISTEGKVHCVNFYFNGKKYLIKGLSYFLSEKDIFGQIRVENIKNEGLFPKVKNGYGEKIVSINGEYLSDEDLKNKFLLKGLRRFIIEFILNFHSKK